MENMIKEAVESYMGVKVTKIEVVRDRQVEGTYAVHTRSKIKKGVKGVKDNYWLLVGLGSGTTVKDIEYNLEEVEFETWPPTSHGL